MNPENKIKFNEFLQTQLNEQQLKAVQATDAGSYLVIAGAGSGKTRVITARIAHLILNMDVQSHEIVALTFTNKAAKEMQERIKKFLGSDRSLPFIGTFHSYCLRLLKQNQELLETPFFSILDEDDQQKLLFGIISRAGLQKETTAKNLSYQISHIKNHATDLEHIESLFAANKLLRSLFAAYEQEKKASKCLDFDDLLLESLKLFHHKDFKKEHLASVQHILVDEYQDTNVVQHTLLKQMSLNDKNSFAIDSLCVVGDEDQSIYSWRGATIANIINFKQDFPQTVTIKIEQNYRSVQSILEVANSVIGHNKNRNPKKLWSEKIGTDRIRQLTCLSEYQEGDIIAQLATAVSKHTKLSSIAVLYRTHYQSRAIEEALIRNSIPYKIIGGTQFYERKEIRDLLAYLRLIVNPFDRASLFRVVNVPTRGLGAKFEELFYEYWHTQPFLTFIDVAKKLIAEEQVTGIKKTAVEQFIKIFNGLKATDNLTKALDSIIASTAYLAYLKESFELEDALSRIDNIKELLNAAKHFESTNIKTIEQFLDEVALMQEKASKKNEEQDAILLMSLHAAKGLEFDTIILAGLEEGLLPSTRSMAQEATLEEERRLFYVGITRARERLLLTHARYRYAYRTMTDQTPSRFLKEIPTALIAQQDCSYIKNPELKSYFLTWFGIAGAAKTSSSPVLTFGTPKQPIKAPVKKENYKPAAKLGTASSSSINTFGSWKKNQPVQHATFGTGLISEIEVKGDKTVYLTVSFKVGKKKIDAKFIKAV